MDFKIGADPELFVFSMLNNRVVNAHGMVEGTKKEPFPVKDGAIQVDGMALEFNISPASTMEEFLNNIESVSTQLQERVGLDFELRPVPSVVFTDEDMKNAPAVSVMLGCDPDYNAWEEGDVNPSPDSSTNLRTGAGHIHVGWTEGMDVYDPSHVMMGIGATKQLDVALGVQSILWDQDKTRRELYGKAGAFRPKSYGVEYRVLSNAWLGSKTLINHVYNVTLKAMNDLADGVVYFDDFNPINIINNSDVDKAKEMVNNIHNKFGVPVYV